MLAEDVAALARLRAEAPEGRAELVELDLADLTSVERFTTAFLARGQGLDLLYPQSPRGCRHAGGYCPAWRASRTRT